MDDKVSKFARAVQIVEQITVVRAIRIGLVNIIPILTIGAFALILKTFPLEAYQYFLHDATNEYILKLIEYVYSATFGFISLYMTYSISRAYTGIKIGKDIVDIGSPLAALLAFAMLIGIYLPTFSVDSLGPKSMFLAIIAGLGASAIYTRVNKLYNSKYSHTVFSNGADRAFNRMMSTILPIITVAIIFAVVNLAITSVFEVESFREFLIKQINYLFSGEANTFFKGLFFVFISSTLWFFGIHGSNVLEDAMQANFATGLSMNQAAVEAGLAPNVVLTKEFFDCFVLMGGCGATICLLIAILTFSNNKARRGLGLTAAFPMIFNINELMVFGLPIIINPTMLIPFFLAPMVCYTISYLAIYSGIVPMITSEVAWTTPVLLGGFRATGSIAGSLLQLLNIAIGVLIYAPFVKLLDKQTIKREKDSYYRLIKFFKDNEQNLSEIKLIDMDNELSDTSRGLCAELKFNLIKKLVLDYQPQYNYNGECVGVEALLNIKHPIYGRIYPPLVIKLASESDILTNIEEVVFKRVLKDRKKVLSKFGKDIKISVNITGTTVVTDKFLKFCSGINSKDHFENKNICIEITEQSTVDFNDNTISNLRKLREFGIMLAIDDFSMGQTSVNYLKENIFNYLKLDGSLIREMFIHENNQEIISSIIKLASSLNMEVIAEFVETEEQRDILHNLGCNIYQGYLYSPSVSLDD